MKEVTPHSQSDRLMPLFFEVFRKLKSQWAQSSTTLPSYLHLETLRYVNEVGAPTMRDIADYLKVAAPTATTLVNSFVKEGIIERRDDPDDRRRVRLALSVRGKKLLKDTLVQREAAFQKVFESLSRNDRKELIRILETITTR